MRSGWTRRDYAVFRLVFGGYLFVHLVQLLPWGAELFSDSGMLPDASVSPLTRIFPNLLAWLDAPAAVALFIGSGAAASLAFAVGLRDRLAAIWIWYVLACLFGRNPLIANPSLPYVGLVLLAHAILPPAGRLAARPRETPTWRMDPRVRLVVWSLMALGYTYSGFTKLASPSWIDGSAFAALLDNPLARPGVVRDLALSLPAALLAAATWGALALELTFAPLALVRRLRPFLWASMTLMHVSLIALVDFADLSLGMLALHGFTLDPDWFRPGGPLRVRVRRRGPRAEPGHLPA